MMVYKKTDNHDPRAKLSLRRYFLERYHPHGTARILDCCMGSGFLWRELRKKWSIAEYVGLDMKAKKGRLKIDSARYLEAGGWSHDIIDIDTYGSPWRHWLTALNHASGSMTIFLTIGMIRMGGGGNMQKAEREAIGIPKSTPAGIVGALHGHAQRYCLSAALVRFRVVEALEAESN